MSTVRIVTISQLVTLLVRSLFSILLLKVRFGLGDWMAMEPVKMVGLPSEENALVCGEESSAQILLWLKGLWSLDAWGLLW